MRFVPLIPPVQRRYGLLALHILVVKPQAPRLLRHIQVRPRRAPTSNALTLNYHPLSWFVWHGALVDNSSPANPALLLYALLYVYA